MRATTQHNDKRRGSAMILVVVVTVLLAVVGVMFVMVARIGEMETSAVIDNSDLDTAIDSIVEHIDTVLVEDLFGTDELMLNADEDTIRPGADERRDYSTQWSTLIGPGDNGTIDPTPAQALNNDDVWLPGTRDDIWLASLEPLYQDAGPDLIVGTSDDIYVWPRITDLWGTIQGRPDSLYYQRNSVVDHAAVYSSNAFRKRWVDPDDTRYPTDSDEGWNTTGLWDKWEVSAKNVRTKVIRPGERTQVVAVGIEIDADVKTGTQTFPNPWSDAAWTSLFGARADADGDGVTDSRWVMIPNLTTSRGKPVFAAVRIIDNCAMLNLNTAHCFYQDPTITATDPDTSSFRKAWYPTKSLFQTQPVLGKYQSEGRYLTDVNYRPWLRGSDLTAATAPSDQNWYRIQKARGLFNLVSGVPLTPEKSHIAVLNNIDATTSAYAFFDIADELEIRNRYLVTSKAETRFEMDTVANFTFNAGGSSYAVLETPIGTDNDFKRMWKVRVDLRNFNEFSGAFVGTDNTEAVDYRYRYDRRHVSTFFSFDRPLRSGRYTSLETALAAEANSTQRQARESVFRPLDNRPVDIRTITNPLEMDGVTANAGCITRNTLEARKNILHLLYAFRAYYMEEGLTQAAAAKKSAQIAANLIDYLDADTTTATGPFGGAIYGTQINANPTYINRSVIRELIREVSMNTSNSGTIDIGITAPATPSSYEFGLGVTDATETVYGLERQPFISELYTEVDDSGAVQRFALEIVNPYDTSIDLSGWRVVVEPQSGVETAFVIPDNIIIDENQGRHVFCSHTPSSPRLIIASGADFTVLSGLTISNTTKAVHLQRPLASGFLSVDRALRSQIVEMLTDVTDGSSTYHSSKRDDTGWAFTDCTRYYHDSITMINVFELGSSNGITPSGEGYQLPVANSGGPIYTVGDFVKVAFVSNEKDTTTSKTITEQIANAGDESDVRYDIEGDPELLDYICFLNRPEEGSLPGRININTAAKYVIAAAIPPQLVMTATGTENALNMAEQIVANRPYERVSDLLKIAAFKKFEAEDPATVGDTGIAGDFEKRDWILSRLSNIFTVRSDVFTAYLLVRLGEDGPERRMIAIFDRSQCWTPSDRPRLVALHPVPDPR